MTTSFPNYADPSPLSNYFSIRLVAIIFTVTSLVCSIITAVVYVYLCFCNYEHAQRLTLQFVMVATVAAIIVEILDIINWTLLGNSTYCGGARTVILFFNCINAAALSCIGLNLVIILYFGMPKQRAIKPFYYPGIVLLSLIAISVPIYQAFNWYSQSSRPVQYERSCWYYSRHFDGTGESNFFWLWYYCFIFLIITVSACLSMAAMWKLHSAYKSKKSSSQEAQEQTNNSIFYKVGVRCILYSLVPFIVNVWSFIVQFVEFCPNHSNYPISCIDAALSSCSGIFVSVIFFSEPTITSFISERWRNVHHSAQDTDEEPPHLLEEHSSAVSVHGI
ncbi:hypothetical protein BCR42DRAFT_421588 [Absidia repens]|uniref:G-protein coupled receptors family 1 profile domain-containing protein n=1 Tax=Absidia repens TaxID=90262 RepID=A0A1X2I7J7_9FUNG|nr:hypothetical protein BCR42DRAFT_421588 [Absidia repens]